ncbi:OLC1v1030238C1 [Oldenlandia corymbosa var. corymbosa]|uniref:OLC1v1030238C1 n=1 Tax=Oldenlandia corymbosa var. corymbosa TaxID=529605 RepID=A0AAV1CFJ2_OLDCO|nr:OLC1v1030238C1 [Oldenlandia corymbosa var. corymbosa]
MEGEMSKLGQRGERIPLSQSDYDNSLRSLPFSSSLGGRDGGQNTSRPSELQMMMAASRSNQPNFLRDLHHRQDAMDSQRDVLTFLEKLAKEAQFLREENCTLKMANSRLTNELAFLREAASQYALGAAGHSGMGIGPDPVYDLNSVRIAMERMGLVEGSERGRGAHHDFQSNHFVDLDPFQEKENIAPYSDRVTLPESISIGSNGSLKTAHPGGRSGLKTNKQRVYVPGGETEKESLELDVHKEGMLKTELCINWQETETCSYGENCQFAHGIKERQPIIHHTRYSEVCRMIMNGVHCPYGHRCYFRHTLTDEEAVVRSRRIFLHQN